MALRLTLNSWVGKHPFLGCWLLDFFNFLEIFEIFYTIVSVIASSLTRFILISVDCQLSLQFFHINSLVLNYDFLLQTLVWLGYQMW